MSTVKMLWTMWCLCIRLSACTVKHSCRSWGELITPHQRITWTLSTRTTNCWRRKTSLSWNRLASRSRSCLACGLQSRPHYSRCRTHVSPPAGRFETSREEVCQGLDPLQTSCRFLSLLKVSYFPGGWRNAGAEVLLMRSSSLTRRYHVVFWKNDMAGFHEWRLY